MRILLSAIYPYAFLLLYLIIPFDNYVRALPNILMAILIIAFPFIVKKEDFRKLKTLPFVLFLSLFLFLFLNSFFSGRLMEDLTVIKKVLIALGLVILYIPVADFRKINSAIIFSALAAIIFSIYNFVLITDATGSFALGDSPQVVESLLVDRIYLGLLSTLSILISYNSIKRTYHPNNNYYLANILVNGLFIVLIASKIALVALFVLFLIKQFYGKRRLWSVVAAGIALVLLSGLFIYIKNESREPLSSTNQNNKTIGIVQNSMTWELRSVVWHCAQNVIEEEGLTLTGLGFDGSKDRLVACYSSEIADAEKKETFVSQRYNTHNQFLDFYISAGFIALLLFVGFFIISFLSVRKSFFPTAILALLLMYCLVENVFYRQIGAYYVGFILIMVFAQEKLWQNNEIKNL